jgi:hypothetical protein
MLALLLLTAYGTFHAPLLPPLRVTTMSVGDPLPKVDEDVPAEKANVTLPFASVTERLNALGDPTSGLPVPAPRVSVQLAGADAGAVTTMLAGLGVDDASPKLTVFVLSEQAPDVTAIVPVTAPVDPPVRFTATVVVPEGRTLTGPPVVNESVPGPEGGTMTPLQV